MDGLTSFLGTGYPYSILSTHSVLLECHTDRTLDRRPGITHLDSVLNNGSDTYVSLPQHGTASDTTVDLRVQRYDKLSPGFPKAIDALEDLYRSSVVYTDGNNPGAPRPIIRG